MEIENIIRNLALKNAVEYKGKANPKAIMGKVLGEHSEWRDRRSELASMIDKIVGSVNKMPPDEQRKALEESAPEMLEKKKPVERNIFAFLGIEEGSEVVTAFPPGPEKYPHIGHAKSLLLNYMLAKQYGGKFILRFEDTNPKLVQGVFYEIMQENFRWIGAEWDELQYASDHMDLFYNLCEKALAEGNAYVCSCDGDRIKHSRDTGEGCSCRDRSPDENLELWKNMPTLPVGHAIVRLKIDLTHQNTTMRDPTIFRILDEEHARHGKKYRVWPNYDWQNSIMDGHFGVTHRIRGKEFELRNELQRYIQRLLGLNITKTHEYGRFNFIGVEASGRRIREGIENGEFLGWDDPALTTLVALRRRGFQPAAIRDFVISTGISKAEATLTWDDMILHNRRLLDASVNRYFFIANPQELWVKGAGEATVELNLHPEHRRGGRKLTAHDNFWITKEDKESLEEGKLYRLMDCLNFRVQADGHEFVDREVETYKRQGEKIMHWLPHSEELADVTVMMPDKETVTGYGEPGIAGLNVGDVVQFERFGFCRLDSLEDKGDGKKRHIFVYTHK